MFLNLVRSILPKTVLIKLVIFSLSCFVQFALLLVV